jgi:hypothetical protein
MAGAGVKLGEVWFAKFFFTSANRAMRPGSGECSRREIDRWQK